MNTEQIMAAVERYRTAGGREEHHAYKDQLEAAIEALVQERDALKNQLEEANSGWYDKLLEATLERDALKDTLQDVRGHYERVCKERDTQVEADKLAAENKVLRDGLQAYKTQLEKDTNESDLHALMRQGVEIADLKAGNKVLRDALEYVLETCDWHGDDGRDATSKACAALQGANHE
jgi:uncharacterized protein involved in exopolysaccharide biosynthesis